MKDDSRAYAERLQAAYENDGPRPPMGIEVPEGFWYIHFKAFAFLKTGPEEYRSFDALQQPSENLPAARLQAIKRGCEQILQFRGLSADRPLEGLGVDGFYALLRVFHFVLSLQAARSNGAADTILDRMTMRHCVDGRELTLYNLVTVKPASDEAAGATPCPYCGELLRTAFARQCRNCGMDWHGPDKVVNRKAGRHTAEE